MIRVTLVEDKGPEHLPQVKEDTLTLSSARNSRAISRVESELHPPPPPLLEALRRAKTPRTRS